MSSILRRFVFFDRLFSPRKPKLQLPDFRIFFFFDFASKVMKSHTFFDSVHFFCELYRCYRISSLQILSVVYCKTLHFQETHSTVAFLFCDVPVMI